MLSKALASKRSLRLLVILPTAFSRSFLLRATTCAKRRDWPANFRAASLRPAPPKHKFKSGEVSSMSISREEIRQLAEFQDAKCCALSFYFQPSTPRNKAHKEDTILIKDLAREAVRNMESKAKKDGARADIDRILRLSGELRSNGTHAKAVFACAAQNIWQEYDLSPNHAGTQMFVGRHFHLKPLAHL